MSATPQRFLALPWHTHEALKRIAQRRSMSMVALVRSMVIEASAQLDNENRNARLVERGGKIEAPPAASLPPYDGPYLELD